MERAREARRVPGEGAPLAVVIAALAVGLALTGAALVHLDASGPPPEAPPRAEPAALEPARPAALTSVVPSVASVLPPAPAEPPLECREPLVVPFERASHELTGPARREVRAFARWAAAREGRVLVRGHADRDGSSAHNLALSDRRARAVGAVLRAQGLAEERVLLQAFGEYQPLGRSAAQNRRVEIRLEGLPPCGGAT